MQNAESNPTQAQQNEMAAKSPVKTPATGGTGPDADTQAKEFGSTKHATSAEGFAAKKTSPLPDIDLDSVTKNSGDPVVTANSRKVTVNTANTASTDNTVDTDGKSLEAAKEESGWQDNIIGSNATLENNVPVPAQGLGGFDSRLGGNHPLIAARAGYRVVHRGVTYEQQLNGARAEFVFSFEPVSGATSR